LTAIVFDTLDVNDVYKNIHKTLIYPLNLSQESFKFKYTNIQVIFSEEIPNNITHLQRERIPMTRVRSVVLALRDWP